MATRKGPVPPDKIPQKITSVSTLYGTFSLSVCEMKGGQWIVELEVSDPEGCASILPMLTTMMRRQYADVIVSIDMGRSVIVLKTPRRAGGNINRFPQSVNGFMERLGIELPAPEVAGDPQKAAAAVRAGARAQLKQELRNPHSSINAERRARFMAIRERNRGMQVLPG